MKISDAGLDLIRSFEGYHDKLPDGSCRAYLDKLAKPHIWTIGWGCTEGVKQGMVWTREQADEGLRREVAKFEAAVDRLVTVEMNQNQFDACVSFSYNVGLGGKDKKGNTIPGFSTSTLLKKLNKGDYKGAAGEFKRWKYAGGKVWPGLVDRRAREATLFLTPVEVPEAPAMPQVVEPGPAKPAQGTVATVAAGVGGGAVAVAPNFVPAPPPEITETVTQLSAWQTIVASGQSIAMFGWEHWPWVLAAAATFAGLTYWNRRASA